MVDYVKEKKNLTKYKEYADHIDSILTKGSSENASYVHMADQLESALKLLFKSPKSKKIHYQSMYDIPVTYSNGTYSDMRAEIPKNIFISTPSIASAISSPAGDSDISQLIKYTKTASDQLSTTISRFDNV